jgi:DNA-binding NarL/FixJ family response regulator
LLGVSGRGSILVVDDDPHFAEFIQTVLEHAGYQTIVAATGEEAISLARQYRPSLVLLDIQLPILNGYGVCNVLRREFGESLKIAFVSGERTGPLDVSVGLMAGADEYLIKPLDATVLLARVEAILRRLVDDQGESSEGRRLTGRELEVLGLLADGLDQRDIARQLSISPKTVGIHIEHILEKLNVHSRAQAVAAAFRENLLVSSH